MLRILFFCRNGCLYVKELPVDYTIKYARWADRTMYLVPHQDKVHGEYQYILAHYQVEHCTKPDCVLCSIFKGKKYSGYMGLVFCAFAFTTPYLLYTDSRQYPLQHVGEFSGTFFVSTIDVKPTSWGLKMWPYGMQHSI